MERPREESIALYQGLLNPFLETWQEEGGSLDSLVQISVLIYKLNQLGFGFTLKVKKKVLNNSGSQPMAVSSEDAIKYGNKEGEFLVFKIPSTLNPEPGSNELFMEISAAQSGSKTPTHLTLRNRESGTFARFIPTEISSIELK